MRVGRSRVGGRIRGRIGGRFGGAVRVRPGAAVLVPLIPALALLLAGCGSSGDSSSAHGSSAHSGSAHSGSAQGTSAARVSVSGTVRGVGGPSGNPPRAVSATIAVSDSGGHEVAHTDLDEHGAYAFSLAPGSYRLSFRDANAPCPGRDLKVGGTDTAGGGKGQVVDIVCSMK